MHLVSATSLSIVPLSGVDGSRQLSSPLAHPCPAHRPVSIHSPAIPAARPPARITCSARNLPAASQQSQRLPDKSQDDACVCNIQRTILVALPLSADADGLLSWVADNIIRRGNRVHCAHFALEDPGLHASHEFSFTPGGWNTAHDVFPAPRQHSLLMHSIESFVSRDMLEKHGHRLLESGVALSVSIRPVSSSDGASYVGKAVCRLADDLNADLVAMSTHHEHSKLAQWLPGSATDHALKHCSRPVLVLHGGKGKPAAAAGGIELGMSAGRQLLVATDSTDDSLMACQWVLQHMHRAADVIRLVHVVPFLDHARMAGSTTGGMQTQQSHDKGMLVQRGWQHDRAAVFEDLFRSADTKYSLDVLLEPTTDPTSTISSVLCREAKAMDASFVLMTAHHHPMATQLMLGSVLDRLVVDCTVPVIVLKGHPVVSVRTSRGIVT